MLEKSGVARINRRGWEMTLPSSPNESFLEKSDLAFLPIEGHSLEFV
jgi:hypothetical protein